MLWKDLRGDRKKLNQFAKSISNTLKVFYKTLISSDNKIDNKFSTIKKL